MNIKRKTTATTFFLLAVAFLLSSKADSQTINARNYPLLKSVKEINKNTSDTCRLQSYVVSIYTCPPCPPGAECKPCIGDYLTVADSVGGKNLFRVFVDDANQFTMNKKYTLLIRLHKSDADKVYEANLLQLPDVN